jgi:hypothetical protein
MLYSSTLAQSDFCLSPEIKDSLLVLRVSQKLRWKYTFTSVKNTKLKTLLSQMDTHMGNMYKGRRQCPVLNVFVLCFQ